MAIRMQQRRATLEQWLLANPVLAAGEIGFETDTGSFKIGDGVNTWDLLDYFDSATTLQGTIDDYVPLSQKGQPLGVAELDAQGQVPASQLQYVDDRIEDVVGLAPEQLDTLSELADALGGDDDFFNSVYAAISQAESDAKDHADNQATVAEQNAKQYTHEELGAITDGAPTDGDTLLKINNKITAVSDTADNLGLAISALEDVVETNSTSTQNNFDAIQNLESDLSDLADSVDNSVSTITNDISSVQSDITDLQTLKAPLDGPSFTGTVILPGTTSIGDVSSTEIGFLDGVTSGIQSQIDTKLASDTAASTYAPLNSPTFGGTVELPATTSIGDVSATEIGYLDGVTSSIQDQLNDLDTDKAPIESPTFTGTVSGVTASMVGLGNVDNTSDLDKPVSNATQTALNSKLNLSGGTMTGKITLDGDPTQALHAVTKQYVDSVEAGLITRPSVKAATTTNLSGTYTNGTAGVDAQLNLGQLAVLDIDGITSWSQFDGILVKNQTNKAENGRYVVLQIGNDTDTDWILKRCPLCDEASEIPGSYIFVIDGTINEQTGWVQHVDDPATFTVGTDDIDVYQFAGAGTITAGTNVSVTGKQVSVVDAPTFAGTVDVSAAGIELSDGVQTKVGVPSITSFVQKTASYELDDLGLRDSVVEFDSSSNLTVTIPLASSIDYPVGTSIDIVRAGTGELEIAGASGVTVNSTPGLKLREQWSSVTLLKRGTNSWLVYGDLKV